MPLTVAAGGRATRREVPSVDAVTLLLAVSDSQGVVQEPPGGPAACNIEQHVLLLFLSQGWGRMAVDSGFDQKGLRLLRISWACR